MNSILLHCVLFSLLHFSNAKHFVSMLLDNLTDEANYDKTLRPNFGGAPVEVGITMNIDSLGPIDEVQKNFRLDISFRQKWKDSRLSFSNYKHSGSDRRANVSNWHKNITLSHDFLEKIWIPDTYFPDSLRAFKQDVMVPNVLIRLSPDGSILYSARATIIPKCPMDLFLFPMDSQTCSLLIECYGYTVDELKLSWADDNGSVTILDETKKLAQFNLKEQLLTNYTLNFSTGRFADLEIKFLFERDLLYFILQSYVPSTLIVMCSWVAFWVNREGIPGRACLSITTVLSLITLIGSTNSKLPNVSTVKALDVYFALCFVYVFGGLLEFACVIYLSTKEKEMKNCMKAQEEKAKKYLTSVNASKLFLRHREISLLKELEHSFFVQTPQRTSTGHNARDQAVQLLHEYKGFAESKMEVESRRQAPLETQFLTASRIEVYSRILFPSSFFFLEFIYWIVYMLLNENSKNLYK